VSDNRDTNEQLWERGWDGHAEAQRSRVARWPLWVKLQWLEDAQHLAEQLRRGRGEEPMEPPPDR